MKSLFVNYVLAAERLDAANAVEARLPFLDHKLFELVRNAPASLLARGGRRKYLLREATKDVLTPEVYGGGKQPFFAPPATLRLNSPLYVLLQDLIRSADFSAVPFFDHTAVLRLLDRLPTLEDSIRSSLDPLLFMMASLSLLHGGLLRASSKPDSK
jgi:asparagine synthase (glutamine-hydrolysing)